MIARRLPQHARSTTSSSAYPYFAQITKYGCPTRAMLTCLGVGSHLEWGTLGCLVRSEYV
jgi:hypothetical protein